MNYSPLLTVMVRAARKAGALAVQFFDRRHQLEVAFKGKDDPVTSADTAVEKEILFHLRKAYPRYGILAEESPPSTGKEEWQWVVDPIDGTLNFLHGNPHFALSIGLARGDELQAGVVYDPVRDELFTAERGRGAFLNDQRIRVSDRGTLNGALIATGFPLRRKHLAAPYLSSFAAVFAASADIRRAGSASLDLAYTAAGRFDGFWESGLSPWDIAAGCIIVQEAGGFCSDFQGGNQFLGSGNIVAGNPNLHRHLLTTLEGSELPQALGQSGTGPG
ncbi:MAG: inositol monophosphatase [Magnetococcales bacterium]|nr:inositol monophosphatase [Magnetococcales bacterium]MBF0156264.1 inositol monophosphatase [Magnetococcales bacterium]